MKLLTVFNGANFSKSTIDFASYLNAHEPVLLTSVFLPSVDYSDVMIYYLGGIIGPIPTFIADEDEETKIEKNINLFEKTCVGLGIEYRVHRNSDLHALEVLKKETRYSDLLLLSSELFYSNLGSGTQKEYLKDTMHNAECPIVLIPEKYVFPKSVIIAYDGSPSSVFALKQFAYLFPKLALASTVIVYASAKDDEFPNLPYIEELAARHFKDLSFYKLEADPKKYFGTWITERGDALLVAGAYGRSIFAEIFKKNFAEEIVWDHKLPVFIAHQ